jgi:glycosyltransferase involved in cell wall biosynthesis
MNDMRILAFAYACDPGKGSEPGAGWAWARMLAQLGETWVVTRANNREPIEAAIGTIPERDRLHFVYVDLPSWARVWKRGQRGIRLYYLLWQAAALRTARTLERECGFDLVWHVTLANAWLGSTAALVGPAFVYGPVGGGVSPPWRLLSVLGLRGAVYELTRASARLAGRYLNPLARVAWRRAQLILVQNPETRRWLPPAIRGKTHVFPHAVVDEALFAVRSRRESPNTALFAGRLLPWKGAALAIRAVAQAPGWRLVICGQGPDGRRLRRLAARLGVEGRVEFRGLQPRAELARLMTHEADILLFPSLHDDAPLTVAEALASGLPIVCLERGGPPVLGGEAAVRVHARGSSAAVASRLAKEGLNERRLQELTARAVQNRARDLLLTRRAEDLIALLDMRVDGVGTLGSGKTHA